MATPREIKKQISVIQNTKKITKTMEMVSTAKAKKASDKVNRAIPYAKKIQELMGSIASSNIQVSFPLLRNPSTIKKKVIFAITSDRGLCGAFNNNVIKLTQQQLQADKQKNIDVDLYIVGKKMVSTFKYLNLSYLKSYTNIEEKLSFEFISDLMAPFLDAYRNEKIDAFQVISTRYMSSSSQQVKNSSILPFNFSTEEKLDHNEPSKSSISYLFEPNSKEILYSLLPKSISLSVYQIFLESIASEHIARRIAMKNATDNASELLRNMTRQYNRARQAKITQEISEIVGGAAAIS